VKLLYNKYIILLFYYFQYYSLSSLPSSIFTVKILEGYFPKDFFSLSEAGQNNENNKILEQLPV
jgi:hypothetical protein